MAPNVPGKRDVKKDPSVHVDDDSAGRPGRQGLKTYGFSEDHDPGKPAQWWFQESQEGLVLFVVLYTLACRWARCASCNLPSLSSAHHVGYRFLIAQVDSLFENPEIAERHNLIRKVILSNNGSVLDEETFSSTALMYFLARLNLHLPNLSALSLETRVEYVDLAELEFLRRALEEGDTATELELAIGFEAFDERIRNKVFQKGLSLREFEGLVEKIQPYGYRLKCYVMQKPVPKMSDADAVTDIKRAIDYLSGLSDRYRVRINLHLNPTYVASGTFLADAFRKGAYTPPRLVDVARSALYARDKPLSAFIGLSDEGLAVPGGSFIREGDRPVVERLEEFNRTQDYRILASVVEEASGHESLPSS